MTMGLGNKKYSQFFFEKVKYKKMEQDKQGKSGRIDGRDACYI